MRFKKPTNNHKLKGGLVILKIKNCILRDPMLIYLSGFNLSSKKFNYPFGPIILKSRPFNEP